MTPVESDRVPLTRLRRLTARAMDESARVPQFTLEVDVDVRELRELRSRRRDAGLAGTTTDMLVAAVARALVQHPGLNSSFDGDAVLLHRQVNIGLAIALPDGLIVPCIHDANLESLTSLRRERVRLTDAAHEGRLRPEDVHDTTFTISTLGALGVARFRALVTPPQAGVLAVGAPPRDLTTLALSCDHRAVDGEPAARFLRDVRHLLESPSWLATVGVAPELAS